MGLIGLATLLATTPALAGKPVDADNDGYNTKNDCNDNDPLIYPGAPEICGDGIDQNCDGVPDDGCGGGPVCTDNDGDGYGFPADASCSYPEEDCNDALASVNPGATENCGNGIDDDCDGLIDAADPNCSSSPHASLTWADYPDT